jgi:hypothetical protein
MPAMVVTGIVVGAVIGTLLGEKDPFGTDRRQHRVARAMVAVIVTGIVVGAIIRTASATHHNSVRHAVNHRPNPRWLKKPAHAHRAFGTGPSFGASNARKAECAADDEGGAFHDLHFLQSPQCSAVRSTRTQETRRG